MKLIDIHCHILPGIDDGARDMRESAAAMREYARQGFGTVIATPHHHPGRYVAASEDIYYLTEKLQKICDQDNIDIRILPGQECLYYSELTAKLDKGEALTLAGSRCVLVEFYPEANYSYIKTGLAELINGGYYPVLAHFERYEHMKKPEQYAELKNMGVMLQMNFDTISVKNGLFSKNPWRKLVKDGTADLVASDCHGMRFRPLRADAAIDEMKKFMTAESLETLLRRSEMLLPE